MADVTIAVIINAPAAISAVFTPIGAFTAPVAPNTNIGSIAITPNGALTLSGADAAKFAITAPSQGVSQMTNKVQLDAGTYNLILTVTPAWGAMQNLVAAGGDENLTAPNAKQLLTDAGGFQKL